MDYNVTNDIHPKLNAFSLSHNHFTTMKQGYLYPIAWLECVPGDIHSLSMQSLVRCVPLVAPIMNNLTMDIHAFFVPTRLLWNKWEDFITTIDQDSIPPKSFNGQPPVWCENENDDAWTLPDINLHENVTNGKDPALWEYFGLSQKFSPQALKERRPTDFLRRAYYFIYNEWFRDENLQSKVDFRYTNYAKGADESGNYQHILRRSWRKDYFTAGFYSRQKGTAPAIPLTGKGSAVWAQSYTKVFDTVSSTSLQGGTATPGQLVGISPNPHSHSLSSINRDEFLEYLNNNSFDLSNVGTFTVNDLRDMFAIQKFLERLMLSGSRYIEFLQSQFGVSPSDSRLQIPERIGGTSFNINISEVIQTSSSTQDSPQGNQTGHGLSVSAGDLGTYKAEEFGYIIVIANIQPPAVYTDRMPRELYRKTLLEQYNPHFVNLSFQAVNNREIYSDGTEQDDGIFNYSGRYDEMREKTSYVTGQFYVRKDEPSYPGYLQYRSFDNLPGYNSEFIEAKPSVTPFTVQNEDTFLCNFYFDFKSLRPIPLISEPGLIDHVYGG